MEFFKSMVELYTLVSNNVAPGDVKKIKVLHEVHYLEPLLIWQSQFEELMIEKPWDPADCFSMRLYC